MKEKLLMVCYRAPYPLRSGSEIRMYQFVEILSNYYDIDLLYLKERAEGDMTPLYSRCRQVKSFEVSKPKRCIQAGWYYIARNWPLQLGYFFSAEMQQWIDKNITSYKNVLCMHVRTMSYLINIKGIFKKNINIYFDGIDAISLNYRNSYVASKGLRKLINKMEYKRMEQWERKVYSLVKNSVLISERDRDYIVNDLAASCDPHIVYNYAIDYGYEPDVKKESCTLAFMGKMNYQPNVDAVMNFVKKVYPSVKKRYPQLKFNIIGGNATPEIQKLEEIDGICVCGFVENPAELLMKATIVIAPMISGSGLQNKIVQAMYLSCMVMTTKIGADGLNEISGNEIVIADDEKDMVKKLLHYLKPEAQTERNTVGAEARKYIQQNYSYEAIEIQMKQVFGLPE